jgi:hypothetical protein
LPAAGVSRDEQAEWVFIETEKVLRASGSLTREQNMNILSSQHEEGNMTALVRDFAALVSMTTFIASLAVLSEVVRLLF